MASSMMRRASLGQAAYASATSSDVGNGDLTTTPRSKSSMNALTQPSIAMHSSLLNSLGDFNIAPCASFNASLWMVNQEDTLAIRDMASVQVADVLSGNALGTIQNTMLAQMTTTSDSARLGQASRFDDVLVVTNPESWPRFTNIDDLVPRGVDRHIGLKVNLFPQRVSANNELAAPLVTFNDDDVYAYFEKLQMSLLYRFGGGGFNGGRKETARGGLKGVKLEAITRAIDRAVKGVACFELIPFSDAVKAENNWIFLRVDTQVHFSEDTNKKKHRSGFVVGWIFKQSYASDGIWSSNVQAFNGFAQNVASNIPQWLRLPKPLIVASSAIASKMGGHSSSQIPHYAQLLTHNMSLNSTSSSITMSSDSKAMAMWWKFSQEAGLSTCILSSYKIPIEELDMVNAEPIGDGGFGKVLKTTWEHGLYQSGNSKYRLSKHRDDMIRKLIESREHLASQGGEILSVGLAVKFIRGGYRIDASELLANMMDKSWSIYLTHAPPARDVSSGIVFDNSHINPTFGYVLQNNYLGLVMDLKMSDLAKEIDAYAADARVLLQLMTPSLNTTSSGIVRPHSPLWVTTSNGGKVVEEPLLEDASLMRKLTAHNAIVPRKNRVMPKKYPQILANVAHALCFMHAHRIIHRDVKPANILISSNGEGFLADFTHVQYMNKPDAVKGTIGYKPAVVNMSAAASEVRGRSPDNNSHLTLGGTYNYPDGSTDIYAMGVCIEEVAMMRPDDEVKRLMLDLHKKCASLPAGFTMVDVYMSLQQVVAVANLLP